MKKIKFIIITAFGSLLIIALGFMTTASSKTDKCTMDIQCGTGKKCVDGVCTGGINPPIKGKCVKGNFGNKVCSNTGEPCNNDSECWR